MTRDEFIDIVAPIVQNENRKRGNPLFSSVVISQAALETGFGISKIMLKANAIFGIKASKNWKGKVYSSKTQECYDGSNMTTITDYFRAYNSLEESVADYFDLITKLERYRKACVSSNYQECITEIYKGGYATDPNYVVKILQIIKDYNLTRFDEEVNDSPIYEIGKVYEIKVQAGLNVRENPGTDSRILTYEELTEDGKKHAYKRKNAVLKKGTRVTCKGISYLGNNIWMKIPSGYIAAFYDNKFYVGE